MDQTSQTLSLPAAPPAPGGSRSGRFWVNCMMAGGPEMPPGGFRQSGWGREAGVHGVEEYTQVKSVHAEISKHTHWIE